jgi:hypothetical protein
VRQCLLSYVVCEASYQGNSPLRHRLWIGVPPRTERPEGRNGYLSSQWNSVRAFATRATPYLVRAIMSAMGVACWRTKKAAAEIKRGFASDWRPLPPGLGLGAGEIADECDRRANALDELARIDPATAPVSPD